jgi:arginyl-tRNA synthetase
MNILGVLRERFRQPLARLVESPDEYLEMIRPSQNPQFGDYQANFAMPLGKRLGRLPREIAEELLQQTELNDLCSKTDVAGPGFVNLTLADAKIVSWLTDAAADERLGIAPVPSNARRTYVVDFSSPNAAKAMHVGHIRSTVIGDAISRLLRFVGHDVVTDNHLGDWGTQFGMILYGYKHFLDRDQYRANSVQELGRLYKFVRGIMDALDARDALPRLREKISQLETQRGEAKNREGDPKQLAKYLRKLEGDLAEAHGELVSNEQLAQKLVSDAALAPLAHQHEGIRQGVLAETAKLHAGDPENLALWRDFLPDCRVEIQRIYDRLKVSFDHELGESFYHHRLGHVVESLQSEGLARESDGAICVFLEGFETPMIVRKRDGAYLYSTSDLATIEYRVQEWKPDAILYVVDFRQSEHFGKLFATARKWRYPHLDLRHISFGTVLGEDNRPYKTRSGDTVGLEGLLDEAEQRAYAVVCENDDSKPVESRLSELRRREIARTIGIAAIKYADLSQNRSSDYVFSYDKMLSLQGNTATSMQYSYARVQGILARGGIEAAGVSASAGSISLVEPLERQLALRILQLPEAIHESLVDFRPNILAAYLYDLSKSFAQFYDAAPVLKAPTDELRASRLKLCELTARTIKSGLELLGIEVVSQM